jgi:anaerobic magnesium-protoporphyrin IX monomethyl ester cyclase
MQTDDSRASRSTVIPIRRVAAGESGRADTARKPLKILLANPQSVLRNDVGNSVIYDRGFGEHLGIRYLAAVLEREGHAVTIVDCHFEGLEKHELEHACSTGEYDVCGISFVEPLMPQTISLAEVMRAAHPRAVILVGGYGATFVGPLVMRRTRAVDASVLGEAEISMPLICDAIAAGEDWRKLPGLVYLDGDREISTGPAKLVDDLDTIPWPKRGTFDQYYGQANMLASRGCLAKCSYCSITELYSQDKDRVTEGRRVRVRRPEAVAEEMAYLHRQLHVNHFDFLDDNFTEVVRYDKSWATRFADEIKRRGMHISWGMQCRAPEIDEETFRMLHASGLRIASLGIETDVERVIKLFRKGATREANRRGINVLKKLGIHMFIEMIMLEPTGHLDEVRQNIAFLEEIDITANYRQPPICTYRQLALYRGVPITDHMKKLGIVYDNGNLLQYRFIDPKMERLNETIVKWLHRSDEVIRLHNGYLHYQASAAGMLTTSLNAVKLCRSYLEFDLGVYKQAIEFADQHPESTSEEQHAFLDQFMPTLRDYVERYAIIREKLRGVAMRPTNRTTVRSMTPAAHA